MHLSMLEPSRRHEGEGVCGAELRGGQPQAVLEASRSCALALHCNGVHR